MSKFHTVDVKTTDQTMVQETVQHLKPSTVST